LKGKCCDPVVGGGRESGRKLNGRGVELWNQREESEVLKGEGFKKRTSRGWGRKLSALRKVSAVSGGERP